MTVVASPSVSLVNSGTVERAMVASSVVEDVVADGRLSVSQLLTKRKDLVTLKEAFLDEQERYAELQAAVDEEVAHYVSLYEQADAEVANAIRIADRADREYRAALSAVDTARAKAEERQRQENRERIHQHDEPRRRPALRTRPPLPAPHHPPPAPGEVDPGIIRRLWSSGGHWCSSSSPLIESRKRCGSSTASRTATPTR
jgi:hypothetical protein